MNFNVGEKPRLRTCSGKECWYKQKKSFLSYEHSLLVSALFLFVFSSFMFISSRSQAQYVASVSATVPETAYNTKKQQKTWWKTLDPYTQLIVESGSVLAYVTFIAFMLHFQHRHMSRRKLLPAAVSSLTT